MKKSKLGSIFGADRLSDDHNGSTGSNDDDLCLHVKLVSGSPAGLLISG